jgi:hypothetical protein
MAHLKATTFPTPPAPMIRVFLFIVTPKYLEIFYLNMVRICNVFDLWVVKHRGIGSIFEDVGQEEKYIFNV